ncbi:MAG: hypothetical protein LBM77_13700 [Spirochaetaceae bacterium]|nr:hypothetical protein [Spirochaetaceae bacterium]
MKKKRSKLWDKIFLKLKNLPSGGFFYCLVALLSHFICTRKKSRILYLFTASLAIILSIYSCHITDNDPDEYVDFWAQKIEVSSIDEIILSPNGFTALNPPDSSRGVVLGASKIGLIGATSGEIIIKMGITSSEGYIPDEGSMVTFDVLPEGKEPGGRFDFDLATTSAINLILDIPAGVMSFTPTVTLSVTDKSKSYLGTKKGVAIQLPTFYLPSAGGEDGSDYSITVTALNDNSGGNTVQVRKDTDTEWRGGPITGLAAGDIVHIKANAGTGWTFQNWTILPEVAADAWLEDSNSSKEECSFKMPSLDVSAVAFFTQDGVPPTYSLIVEVSPKDSGTAKILGEADPVTRKEDLSEGDLVEIQAIPAKGWEFDGWTFVPASVSSNDGDNPKLSKSFSFIMPASVIVARANFKKSQVELTLVTLAAQNGWGTVSPTAVTIYDYGGTAVATARPNAGYRFVRWTRNRSGAPDDMYDRAPANYSFPIESNLVLYAVFEAAPYIQAPASIGLSDTGDVSWVWEGDESTLLQYEIDLYKDDPEVLVNPLTTIVVSKNVVGKRQNIRSELINAAKGSNGNGNYYVKMRALSANKTVYKDSELSPASASQFVGQLSVSGLEWEIVAEPLSLTAKWAASNGPVAQYTARLYYGGALLKTTGNADQVTGVNYTADMEAAGNYTFSVQAIADNEHLYYDSLAVESSAQAVDQNSIIPGFSSGDFPGDVKFNVTRNNGKSISSNVLSQKDMDTITYVLTEGSASNIRWSVGGALISTTRDCVFDSSLYQAGTYTISVRAVIEGIEYSASAKVEVDL